MEAYTRRIAVLVADGVPGADLKALHEGLAAQGAVPRFVSARLGTVESPMELRSKSMQLWNRFPPCFTTRW
jgi:hypothetical protein